MGSGLITTISVAGKSQCYVLPSLKFGETCRRVVDLLKGTWAG